MEVGSIAQSKASYVLPLPSYEAIFGLPFLNGRKLVTYPEKGIATLDDIELPLVKDHDEPPRISRILRSRLKAEIRKNEITELYLATGLEGSVAEKKRNGSGGAISLSMRLA
jgi:hypothetical protein